MKLRWGICTAGKISNDFVVGLSTLPATDHAVVAVAARAKINAQEFATKHGIPVAYEGYEALADDANVDIIYIGAWNHVHLELCRLFLGRGKNVLCEKPLGLNKRQTKEIIDLAKEKNVFLMEGWWSRFFPAYIKLRQLLTEGAIGDVKSVNGSFGFPLSTKERVYRKDVGGGALLDIGVYLFQVTVMVFGGQPPLSCTTVGHLLDTSVDESAVTSMLFPNKATASLTASVAVELSNDIDIRGTKGYIKVCSPFWCPTKIEVFTAATTKTEIYEFPLPQAELPFNFHNSAGFRYEAECIRQCLMKGLKECPIVSHAESLIVAEIIQNARHDVGYVLEEDIVKELAMPCQ